MNPTHFDLSPHHIRLLRKAIVLWDASEGGAPFIGAYGNRVDAMVCDVAEVVGLPVLSPDRYSDEQATAIGRVMQEMGTVLPIVLSCGQIRAGVYSYRNPLLAIEPPEAASAISEIYQMDYGADQREVIQFEIGSQHIRLLRHMTAGWLDYAGVVGVNSKRPYGDRSYYQIDMAEVLELGPEVDDDLHNELETLHQEMQPALQVFVQNAEIVPGRYRPESAYSFAWMRESL